MNVSSRGLRAFRSRPASRRQRSDMVTLAHIKEQSRLSLGSYGRPRMTEELQEIGLKVGHRLVERLTQEFGPVVKVDRMTKEVIQNEETKEPFASCPAVVCVQTMRGGGYGCVAAAS